MNAYFVLLKLKPKTKAQNPLYKFIYILNKNQCVGDYTHLLRIDSKRMAPKEVSGMVRSVLVDSQ
jgi:hypothetical protein